MSKSYSALVEQLQMGKTVVAFTYGDSMEPLLYTNQTQVVITPLKGQLCSNDLPLYRRPSGQFVMHRIIKIKDGYYYTRCDNRIGLEKVDPTWMLGVVTTITRKNKTFSVDNKWYRCYIKMWNFIYPFRYLYYRVYAVIERLRIK